MQGYVICIALLCAPAALGMYAANINTEFAKYRDDCIAKVGLTNTDVISQIKSRTLPNDGSADAFALCMLQTFHVLYNDGTVNPDISSYYLTTDHRDPVQVSRQCVTKSGSVDGSEAIKMFKCLQNNGIVVLPFS